MSAEGREAEQQSSMNLDIGTACIPGPWAEPGQWDNLPHFTVSTEAKSSLILISSSQ